MQSPGDGFPEPVLTIYNQRVEDANLTSLLSIEESKRLLIALSAGFLRTTLIIDALDECDTQTRAKLFNIIEGVVALSKRNPVKAFITSRDDGDVRRKFKNSPNVYIEKQDNSSDIKHYNETEIEACIHREDILDGNVSRALQGRIVSALEAGAHGM